MLADDRLGWRAARRGWRASTFFGNPASPHAERHLDLTGIGRLLALSTHRERNSLACVHYRQEFGREKVYRLRNLAPQENTDRAALAGSLLAPPLFTEDMTHGRFAEMLELGWRIKLTRLSSTFDWPHFIDQYGSRTVLMFGIEEKGIAARGLVQARAGAAARLDCHRAGAAGKSRKKSGASMKKGAVSGPLFRGHCADSAAAAVNCASSVEPVSAVVDD